MKMVVDLEKLIEVVVVIVRWKLRLSVMVGCGGSASTLQSLKKFRTYGKGNNCSS